MRKNRAKLFLSITIKRLMKMHIRKNSSTVNDEQYMKIDVYHNVNESAFAKKLDELLQNKITAC